MDDDVPCDSPATNQLWSSPSQERRDRVPMTRDALRIAWYRFSTDLPRRWRSYLLLTVLIGIIGGLSLGSIAGARRSESAYPAFLKTTDPSDLAIDIGTYNPKILREIARLPDVTSIETYVSPNAVPVSATGSVDFHSPEVTSNFDPVASVNGLYFKQDRMTIVKGRLANPRRTDEVMVNEFAARLFHFHVGQVVRYGFFTNAQLGSSGVPSTPSTRIVNLRITGIGFVSTEVVQDQLDKTPEMVLTPALTKRLLTCCVTYAWSGLRLRHGAVDVGKVESGYLHLLPPGYPYFFHVTSVVESEAEQAVKPEAIALGVFGLIAGLAALIIAGQLISRLILEDADKRRVMWFVGASPGSVSTDSLLGIVLSLLVGSLLAGVVATALSPLLIFGPVQTLHPSHRVVVDWTVIGLGALALFLSLSLVSVVGNVRASPSRRRSPVSEGSSRASSSAHVAAGIGLPVTALLGVRFATERGQGRTSVPVRSTMMAATLAIAVVVATLSFGSSLDTLTSTPRLYGWNWSAMLESDAGYGAVPQTRAAHLLNTDSSVSKWTGIYFDSLLFDGQAVPVVGTTPSADVAPALLEGHEVDGPRQVVLGPATLAALHKHIGDMVRVTGGSSTVDLRIVGVATMPTVGIGFGLHLSIGSGAFLDYRIIPASVRGLLGMPYRGPNAILVRFRSSTSPSVARRSLTRIVTSLNKVPGAASSVQTFYTVRPAEITNYESMGSVPLLLALTLALGAVVALTLTLLTSVRRRRRDLALLRALGLRRRQLASVIAWQSTVSVIVGVVVGVPLGVVFGRALWDLFAHELFAIPQPAVPVLAIVVVALGAIVLANVIALIPARRAANTPTSEVLKAD
jgi:hypothetical protein